MPEAEGSPVTVQSLAGLGARGSASGSTRGAAQVGEGAAGCAW